MPAQVLAALAAFVDSAEVKRTESASLRQETTALVIICPDDGKQIAFRGRCPKCAGKSWMPAAEHGGYIQRMRVRGMRVADGLRFTSESA